MRGPTLFIQPTDSDAVRNFMVVAPLDLTNGTTISCVYISVNPEVPRVQVLTRIVIPSPGQSTNVA